MWGVLGMNLADSKGVRRQISYLAFLGILLSFSYPATVSAHGINWKGCKQLAARLVLKLFDRAHKPSHSDADGSVSRSLDKFRKSLGVSGHYLDERALREADKESAEALSAHVVNDLIKRENISGLIGLLGGLDATLTLSAEDYLRIAEKPIHWGKLLDLIELKYDPTVGSMQQLALLNDVERIFRLALSVAPYRDDFKKIQARILEVEESLELMHFLEGERMKFQLPKNSLPTQNKFELGDGSETTGPYTP